MSLWTLREYSAADVPQLASLWQRTFGDTESFIDAFFSALPHIGSGVVAEKDGKIVGAAYTISGQWLVLAGGETVPTAYIYGVSVDEEYRGNGVGAMLTRRVYELSKERGAKIVCTLPAEDSLYPWYEKLIGVKPALYRAKLNVKAENLESVERISAQKYLQQRERLLADKSHLCLSEHAMAFEEKLLTAYGGGFFKLQSGIASAYVDDNGGVIRELIVPHEKDIQRAASSVAHALDVKTALLCRPSKSGEKYIAADSPLPSDCVWNLSFD